MIFIMLAVIPSLSCTPSSRILAWPLASAGLICRIRAMPSFVVRWCPAASGRLVADYNAAVSEDAAVSVELEVSCGVKWERGLVAGTIRRQSPADHGGEADREEAWPIAALALLP